LTDKSKEITLLTLQTLQMGSPVPASGLSQHSSLSSQQGVNSKTA